MRNLSKLTFCLFAFLVSILAVSGVYEKVIGQKSVELQTPKSYFDFLFESALFKEDPIDLVCLNATEILKSLVSVPECKSRKIYHSQLKFIISAKF